MQTVNGIFEPLGIYENILLDLHGAKPRSPSYFLFAGKTQYGRLPANTNACTSPEWSLDSLAGGHK